MYNDVFELILIAYLVDILVVRGGGKRVMGRVGWRW